MTENRDERLQIMLTEEELAALDDWRFARRMPSRAAAVRDLLRRGLHAEGVSLAAPRMKSKDYGVMDGHAGDDDVIERPDFAAHKRAPRDGAGS